MGGATCRPWCSAEPDPPGPENPDPDTVSLGENVSIVDDATDGGVTGGIAMSARRVSGGLVEGESGAEGDFDWSDRSSPDDWECEIFIGGPGLLRGLKTQGTILTMHSLWKRTCQGAIHAIPAKNQRTQAVLFPKESILESHLRFLCRRHVRQISLSEIRHSDAFPTWGGILRKQYGMLRVSSTLLAPSRDLFQPLLSGSAL